MARGAGDVITIAVDIEATRKARPNATPKEIKEHPMQTPLDISFQNSEPSEEIRSEIERHAKHLEKFHDRITSCNVTVIAPRSRHQKGGLFKIDIRIAMPSHKDIIVTKNSRRRAGARARRGRDQGCIRRGAAPD